MTTDLSIYEQLLRFQLFQGMSRAELLQMAGSTRFSFHKLPGDHTVAKAGEPCRELLFLISGGLSLTTNAHDNGYSLTECLTPPQQLQPEALFGSQTRYTSTVVTTTPSSFFTLSKDEVLRLTEQFLIIRLNLLNILSSIAQRHSKQPWHPQPSSLRGRFARFLTTHSIYPAGQKELSITMNRLAQEVSDSRLNVSRMLNALQEEGLVVLHRSRIEIPSIEHLIM